MKEGKTTTGFEYSIKDEVLDDWNLLKMLRDVDNGNEGVIVDVAEKLFDAETLATLEAHVKEIDGKVTITGMVKELHEILHSDSETKN